MLKISSSKKKTISLDFDGVLHSYKQGWNGPVPKEDPVEGAQDFVKYLRKKGYEVVIFSSRAKTKEGREGIASWLEKHDFPSLEAMNKKPEALLYIDDRGYRFEGEFDSLKRFIDKGFKSWVEK